jgi:transposase
MVFINATDAEKLELRAAREAALRYSNLCKAHLAANAVLEKANKTLAEALGIQHQAVLDAQAQLGSLKGKVFGRSTERREGSEGPLFDQAPEETEKVTYERKKKRKKFGRTEQPELPRALIDHRIVIEDQKRFGLKEMEGQFEISELINVMPAKFVVEVHRRQKYVQVNPAASAVEAPVIVTAPGPLKLKEGGRYSIEFGVEVGLGKFQWHLPLDRQVRIMKTHGLTTTSQALFAQVDTIAWYLGNHVMPGIVAKIRSHRVNQADETYLENLAKEAKSRFWLWSVMNREAVLFDVFDSRAKKSAAEFLKDIEGVLLTDGYYVYQSLSSERLVLANDWVHVRRKFTAAEKTHPIESKWFVDQIRVLFDIEEELQGKTSFEILAVRKEKSQPLVEAIGSKCRELEQTTLKQSPLGKAVKYTLKLWAGLNVFLTNSEVPLDTNWIERTLRSPVVGRKNYYGAKTLANAKMAAVWFSVIQTCLVNEVEPREYINATLRAILTKQKVLMPWEWPGAKRRVSDPAADAAARVSDPAADAAARVSDPAADAAARVSETVVSETGAGLTVKQGANGSIHASESVS